MRAWTEHAVHRTIVVAPDGPIFANRGEFVIVLVTKDPTEALRKLAEASKRDE